MKLEKWFYSTSFSHFCKKTTVIFYVFYDSKPSLQVRWWWTWRVLCVLQQRCTCVHVPVLPAGGLWSQGAQVPLVEKVHLEPTSRGSSVMPRKTAYRKSWGERVVRKKLEKIGFHLRFFTDVSQKKGK